MWPVLCILTETLYVQPHDMQQTSPQQIEAHVLKYDAHTQVLYTVHVAYVARMVWKGDWGWLEFFGSINNCVGIFRTSTQPTHIGQPNNVGQPTGW